MHKLDGLDTLTQPHTKTHPLLSEQEPMNRRELLPIIRKLVLCIGVFISLLLVLYPPWRVSLKLGGEFSAGRSFIGYHPLLTGKQLDTLLCPLMDEVVPYTSGEHHPPYVLKPYIELYADLLIYRRISYSPGTTNNRPFTLPRLHLCALLGLKTSYAQERG
jgi:hypothetical protein